MWRYWATYPNTGPPQSIDPVCAAFECINTTVSYVRTAATASPSIEADKRSDPQGPQCDRVVRRETLAHRPHEDVQIHARKPRVLRVARQMLWLPVRV